MTTQDTPSPAPDAHLLISSSCPHCKTVLMHLTELVKNGEIAHLAIDNLDQRPELGQQMGIRSLPWLKIGEYQLTGAQSLSELRLWIQRSAEHTGKSEWFAELMSNRDVETVVAHLQTHPEDFNAILKLLDDPETELVVRIGIGVVMESFAGQNLLQTHFEGIAKLCAHADPRVRADACHYVSLSGDHRMIETLLAHQNDSDKDVRESVADALEELGYRNH